jgi:hypothetical protein
MKLLGRQSQTLLNALFREVRQGRLLITADRASSRRRAESTSLEYINALRGSEGTADETDHWCELGALSHAALAIKNDRKHNLQFVLGCFGVAANCKPVKPSHSSQCPNPVRNLSIPAAPIWLRHRSWCHPETDFAAEGHLRF